ncbi:MAG TPA: hypothetical protein DEO70_14155 [Bacteroidales bacterium]|nr:MAG: hypothetical protein A2X11_13520 [Bacteroidetes bacterium GWE2_42_24]HBZ67973.1 hypothetical protein [Bacteroidales bacterium]
MKKIVVIVLLIILAGISQITFSQVVISGMIVNTLKQPVGEASVMLMKPSDSTVVAYNFSNSDGRFTIQYNGKEKELLLSVYGFNIVRQVKRIENRNQTVDFIIHEGAIDLKEVTVKSPKIWGTRDTINYSVGAFRDSTDVVIADVLKKLPGIEVKEDGRIEYQGKAISNFYIENMDMLHGRYGIATNNMAATDIATVQVFENHQPIKVLRDAAFSNDAAINLKLKEGAKRIYSFVATLEAGTDNRFLWNNGITGMYFSKTRQHLASFKTNNTGNDLESELRSFTNESSVTQIPLSYMVMPSPPDINKTRYNFNDSRAGTFNTLKKLNNDCELTFNLVGLQETDDRNSLTRTTYILPGTDTLTISERMASFTKKHKLEGDVGIFRNADYSYLNTQLQFSGNWEKTTGTILENNSVNQSYDYKSLSLANMLHWIRRQKENNQKGIELNSRTMFQSQPYQLQVTPGVFAEILNDSLPYQSVAQDVVLNTFETHNSLMFLSSIVWKYVHFHPVFLFSLEHQTLNTHILKSGKGESFSRINGDSLSNNQDWLRSKAGVSLDVSYRRRDLNIGLSTPTQFQYITLSGSSMLKHSQSKKLLFQPSLQLLYNIGRKWTVTGTWFYYNQNPDLHTLYSGFIVQNYRTLSRYENKLTNSHGNTGSLKLLYKEIMKFLFTSIEFSYSQYNNEVMYAQQFEGSVLKTTLIEIDNSGDFLSVTGRVSKGFDWKKLLFTIEGSWNRGNTPQLRQGTLIEYVNKGVNANITVSVAATESILLSNKCSWGQVTGSTGTGVSLPSISNLENKASLDITLPADIILTTAIEYYDSRTGSVIQNFCLIDAGITHTWKRVRFSLNWTNMLNTKNYVYSYYSNLNSYYSEYTIRPSAVMLKTQFKLY